MIYISIDDENTDLLDNVVASLLQAGYATKSLHDGKTLRAWCVKQERALQAPRLPKTRGPIATATSEAAPSEEIEQTCWMLNSSQLQLTAPDGRQINLSHDACCILQAVIRGNGKLLSRRMLIESMGYNFLHYDERRLESLISRLRRKLASYAPEGFPIRAIKGHGYLFEAKLQAIDIEK